jgi:hypothetical protein
VKASRVAVKSNRDRINRGAEDTRSRGVELDVSPRSTAQLYAYYRSDTSDARDGKRFDTARTVPRNRGQRLRHPYTYITVWPIAYIPNHIPPRSPRYILLASNRSNRSDTVVRSAGEGVVVSLPLGGDDVLVLDLSACVLTRPTPLPYSSAESGQKGGSEKDSKIAVQQCRGGIHSRTGQCVVPFRSLNTWSFFSSSEGSMSERGQ